MSMQEAPVLSPRKRKGGEKGRVPKRTRKHANYEKVSTLELDHRICTEKRGEKRKGNPIHRVTCCDGQRGKEG